MMSYDEALAKTLARVERLGTETVDITDVLGCVLAQDIVSDVDVAPFDNSAMDGYAVRAEDLESATEDAPVVLRVLDHIAAGSVSGVTIGPGEAARIMTGAPVPEGADTVVMIEVSTPLEKEGSTGGTVGFSAAVQAGANIRLRGEELSAGDVVLRAGEHIGAAAIGLMATVGAQRVEVYRRPRVGIVATGDELVDVSEKPGPGRIRNSNGPTLVALVKEAGGVPTYLGIARDNLESTEALLSRAPEFDVLITTGGVSMGDFDIVKDVLGKIGELEFWKVAIKPGVAQTYGTILGTPFFGLPGNPTSTMVAFELFVRPAIRKMRGLANLHRPRVNATLSQPIDKKAGRRHFLRARLERVASAPGEAAVHYTVALSGKQSSAMLSPMHRANCLISLPAEEVHFPAGSVVECIRIDTEEGAL